MRGKTLIINLPGKPKSIRETFDEVFRSIPYCIQVITNLIKTDPIIS
jgi:molybdopterin adenylyltransferase